MARNRDGVAFLSSALVVTGAVLATASILHPAFGVRKLYGVFAPQEIVSFERHVAPFLNPNNLAAYLNVSFCLALAGMLAPVSRWPRPIISAAVLLLAATQLWVASRGGVGTMVLGAALVVIISRAQRLKAQRDRATATASMIVGLGLAAGAFMVVLGSSEATSSELLDTSLSKFVLLREALRMLPSYGALGAGRGAFESTFAAFRSTPGIMTFTHPENVIAQWTIEWGIPLGLAGLVAIVIGLRPNTVLARSSTASGAWAGLVAVAVQNLVDLGSEIPGLILAPVICAAIVVGGSAGRRAKWRVEHWGDAPRLVVVASALVAALAIANGAAAIPGELRADRKTLHDAAVDRKTEPEALHALARAAMLRHPGEPYLPLAVGWRAAQRLDDNPLPWLEAALERGRVEAPAHIVLARLLAGRAPAQARLEYRLAMEQAPETQGPIGQEVARLVHGYDDALEVVSEGPQTIPLLETLGEAVSWRLPSTSERIEEELARRAPMDATPLLKQLQGAVEDLESGPAASWCQGPQRADCLIRALDLAERARLRSPTRCEAYALGARAQVAGGNETLGLSELAKAADLVTNRADCLKELVALAARSHDEARAAQGIAKIAAVGCSTDDECGQNLAWAAQFEEGRGNGRHAVGLYKRAYERMPDNEDLLVAAARLEAAVGMHADARDDYRRLVRRHPDHAEWQQAADAQQQAAVNTYVEKAPLPTGP